MADILIIKCPRNLPCEQLQHILDYFNCLKVQKETGVNLLPSYLRAYTVPDDIEIKLIDENRKEKTNDEHDNY